MLFAANTKGSDYYHDLRNRDGSGLILGHEVSTDWIFKKKFRRTKELFNRLRNKLIGLRYNAWEI